MLTIRPVPARRHDPSMQNFVYKGNADPVTRRKDQEQVTQLARRVRKASEAAPNAGAS